MYEQTGALAGYCNCFVSTRRETISLVIPALVGSRIASGSREFSRKYCSTVPTFYRPRSHTALSHFHDRLLPLFVSASLHLFRGVLPGLPVKPPAEVHVYPGERVKVNLY